MVRPSYVLGGRAMEIVHEKSQLKNFVEEAFKAAEKNPILIDKFINNAMEIDVDALCDGKEVFVAGIMQHIEEAGIHSGDSSCVVPAYNLSTTLRNFLSISKLLRSPYFSNLLFQYLAFKIRILTAMNN